MYQDNYVISLNMHANRLVWGQNCPWSLLEVRVSTFYRCRLGSCTWNHWLHVVFCVQGTWSKCKGNYFQTSLL